MVISNFNQFGGMEERERNPQEMLKKAEILRLLKTFHLNGLQ